MSKPSNPHVVRHPDGGWAIRREGSKRSSSRHPTQQKAIDQARNIARGIGGEVVIHGRNGRIRDKDSYGNDPHPPKDRKH